MEPITIDSRSVYASPYCFRWLASVDVLREGSYLFVLVQYRLLMCQEHLFFGGLSLYWGDAGGIFVIRDWL